MGAMRDLLVLVVHLITTVFQLTRPGGLRAVVAESVLIKHQMLILNRSRGRAPNLRIQDRLIAGFCSLWIKPSRFRKVRLRSEHPLCWAFIAPWFGASIGCCFPQSNDPSRHAQAHLEFFLDSLLRQPKHGKA